VTKKHAKQYSLNSDVGSILSDKKVAQVKQVKNNNTNVDYYMNLCTESSVNKVKVEKERLETSFIRPKVQALLRKSKSPIRINQSNLDTSVNKTSANISKVKITTRKESASFIKKESVTTEPLENVGRVNINNFLTSNDFY
jgi:hypothetical protein